MYQKRLLPLYHGRYQQLRDDKVKQYNLNSRIHHFSQIETGFASEPFPVVELICYGLLSHPDFYSAKIEGLSSRDKFGSESSFLFDLADEKEIEPIFMSLEHRGLLSPGRHLSSKGLEEEEQGISPYLRRNTWKLSKELRQCLVGRDKPVLEKTISFKN